MEKQAKELKVKYLNNEAGPIIKALMADLVKDRPTDIMKYINTWSEK